MKNRAYWLFVPAVAFSLGACGKKETPSTSESTPPAVEDSVVPVPPKAAEKPALGAEERAAKLGFARHLPADTEAVIAFHNGGKTTDRLKASKLWAFVESQMGGNGGMDDMEMDEGVEDLEMDGEDIEQEDVAAASDEAADVAAEENGVTDPLGPRSVLGTEVTLALGKSTGEQTANLLTLSRRQSYFQMRALAAAFVETVKSGDSSTMSEALESGMGPELLSNLINDPESGIALLERSQMPPVHLAVRPDAAHADAVLEQVVQSLSMMGMLGEMVEPVEFEKAGAAFNGYKIIGAKVAEEMAAEREDMEEMLEAETVDKLLAVVAKKDLIVAAAKLGDYVVLTIAGSVDDINFVTEVDQSLAAGNTLAFTDAYASKEIAALVYGEKESLETMIKAAGGIADITNGIRDGLASGDGIGDTRDLEALLQIVAEREAALRKLSSTDSYGLVAFIEDGLKIETFGGTDQGSVDWKAPNKLAHLGDSSDVVIFANVTVDATFDEKSRAYFESLVETAYAMTMKVAEAPIDSSDLAEFKGMAELFDTKFRGDLVSFWEALSVDLGGGLAGETALVVDLKGSVPPIPGLPQQVVDKGRFVRASVISPVEDRAKVAAAWEKINTTSTGLLAKISEMAGEDIPMQKPISSERDGFTTWFFSFPFFNDDFLPSVTVGDDWFALSTSKNQALDLLGQARTGGATRTGAWFNVNFVALQDYAKETFKMVDENSAAIFGEDSFALEEFENNKPDIIKAIEVLDDVESLSIRSHRDEGVLRGSIHLKTR